MHRVMGREYSELIPPAWLFDDQVAMSENVFFTQRAKRRIDRSASAPTPSAGPPQPPGGSTQLSSAFVSSPQLTSAFISSHQPSSAFVSSHQRSSAPPRASAPPAVSASSPGLHHAFITLDGRQRLFLVYGWQLVNNEQAVRTLRGDGHRRSILAPGNLDRGELPFVVHFNGNSKGFTRKYSPAALAARLRGDYIKRTGDGELRELGTFLKRKVRFVSPGFEVVGGVGFADVCSAGSELPGSRTGKYSQ